MGWIVKTFRVNDTVEMRAIKLDRSVGPQIARFIDGEDANCEYGYDCLIAVGVWLDDGLSPMSASIDCPSTAPTGNGAGRRRI
jgi:hypothetical protein